MSVYVDIKKQIGSFELKVKFESGTETLALLGDSGCGKSMTLKCIAGIVAPDEGKIIINGNTVFDSEKKINLRPQLRRVGFLFQNYALFPNMTVKQNIIAGMEREKKLSKKEKQKIAEDYIEKLHLTGLSDNYPNELSGGQQQRCALARILASNPDILLLDEPFSALDAALRWEMEQVVRSTIKDFAGSTLLVTHDRDEVYRLSDKVAVYKNGKIDTFDDKWSLFSKPITATTARLTGCKNLSPAHIENGMFVTDKWGLKFPIRDGDYNWIGIRAHRFEIASEDDKNAFEFNIVSHIEDTFSNIYMIVPAEHPDAEPMRWELDKSNYVLSSRHGRAKINEEDILYLKEN